MTNSLFQRHELHPLYLFGNPLTTLNPQICKDLLSGWVRLEREIPIVRRTSRWFTDLVIWRF